MAPKAYQGKPDDLVCARRRVGYGTVYMQPNEHQQGMPPCACHDGSVLPVVHEGDIVRMFRAEVCGYFNEADVWNDGRPDFELVDEPADAAPPASRTTRAVADLPLPELLRQAHTSDDEAHG